MPRILPVDIAQIQADLAESSSTMSNLFRTLAHRPELAKHAMHLVEAAMRTGTVEPRLKELIAVRVSQVNHCFY